MLGAFLILDALYNQNLYYLNYNTLSIGYNYGAALTVAIIPYLIIGGLMVFDLMRKGAVPPIVKFAAPRMPVQAPSAATAPQQMQAPRQTMGLACPVCGVPVTAADTFCPSCGTKLHAAGPAMPAPVAPGGAKVCNNCGTPNPAGFIFCKRCGNKLL